MQVRIIKNEIILEEEDRVVMTMHKDYLETWIKPILETVYQMGFESGHKEGCAEMTSAFQDEVSHRGWK